MSHQPLASRRARCLSEFLGTYLLVLVGPGTVAAVSLVPGIGAFGSLFIIALSFASVVTLVVLFLGRVSGAHIDPAITLAHAFYGKTSPDMAVRYVLFQFAGAVLAGFTLRLVFDPVGLPADLGSTRLASGVSVPAGILLEAVGTFLLATSGFVASLRIRNRKEQAILVGVALFFLILALGPFTNASLNPARSLGPALASEYLTNLGVYLTGPPAGGLIAGLVFRFLEKPRVGERSNPFRLC